MSADTTLEAFGKVTELPFVEGQTLRRKISCEDDKVIVDSEASDWGSYTHVYEKRAGEFVKSAYHDGEFISEIVCN